MAKKLLLHLMVDKLETKADKSLKLTVTTQELNDEEKAVLFSLHQHPVMCFLKEGEIEPEELELNDIAPVPITGQKTPSQRLRSVLYRLWEQAKPDDKGFDGYYDEMMERIIEFYKSKLE